jgi:hypothetical protein
MSLAGGLSQVRDQQYGAARRGAPVHHVLRGSSGTKIHALDAAADRQTKKLAPRYCGPAPSRIAASPFRFPRRFVVILSIISNDLDMIVLT